jgi:peptidoglycan/LPS O-acetylase OafA/YrhL
MQSSSAKYYPRVDHLRFCAAFLVFTWHSFHLGGEQIPWLSAPSFFAMSVLEEGLTGVSLFLTLSGFIFALLCEGQSVKYGPFIRNRALRVLPLLLVWIYVAYHLNPVPAADMLLMGLGIDKGKFPHVSWTVIVEFQLYLLFPFILRFYREHGTKYLVGLLVVCMLFRTIVWFTTGSVRELAYGTIFGRMDQFVFGMLGASLLRRHGARLAKPFIFPAVLLTWLAIYHVFDRLGGFFASAEWAMWIWIPTVEGAFYSLLAVTYVAFPWHGSRLLGRVFAWLGTVSYSFYLGHLPIVYLCFDHAQKLGFEFSSPARVVAFALVLVLPVVVGFSALTYYVIERPFLSLRRTYFVKGASESA